MQEPIYAIILAAGHSSRMGLQKALLKYSEKLTFLEKIIETYSTFGATIILVTNHIVIDELEKNNIKLDNNNTIIVVNTDINQGRMLSIKLGVSKIMKSGICFIQNIDNPFVSTKTLRQLMNNSRKSHYVSPTFKGKGGHPILISNKIIEDLKEFDNLHITLKEFLSSYEKEQIEINDEKILLNINTIDDYHNIIGLT
ncbi:MAG TPA: hypothetical protein DDX39_10360 [Bacteroidales bacterium]|nr:MAG: hypothetical protein A2W98_15565 [Bacteroidetes bacterium GWF2_33_38]OFY69608.1 MAG: hypothetical protein A2265_03195 [Bacteroidetes bacterium RIFOXYA12_FULL_33_9]HBF89032.1 hypothetical protein [Bacteroidales bacterium]